MKICLLLLTAVLLAGCATVGTASLAIPRGDDWPQLTMSQAELVRELGPPNMRRTSVEDGQILTVLGWTYGRAEFHPALFIPIVGLFVAASGDGLKTEHRSLTVAFDARGAMVSRVWVEGDAE